MYANPLANGTSSEGTTTGNRGLSSIGTVPLMVMARAPSANRVTADSEEGFAPTLRANTPSASVGLSNRLTLDTLDGADEWHHDEVQDPDHVEPPAPEYVPSPKPPLGVGADREGVSPTKARLSHQGALESRLSSSQDAAQGGKGVAKSLSQLPPMGRPSDLMLMPPPPPKEAGKSKKSGLLNMLGLSRTSRKSNASVRVSEEGGASHSFVSDRTSVDRARRSTDAGGADDASVASGLSNTSRVSRTSSMSKSFSRKLSKLFASKNKVAPLSLPIYTEACDVEVAAGIAGGASGAAQ